MAGTLQEKEKENYNRLLSDSTVPSHLREKLRNDRAYQSRFHEYLASHYYRGVDKPTEYSDFRAAFVDFAT